MKVATTYQTATKSFLNECSKKHLAKPEALFAITTKLPLEFIGMRPVVVSDEQ